MLLMSLYVVPVLVFTMKIVIQGHTCDDITGNHGGGYTVVIWESMEPKNTCSYELNDHPNRRLDSVGDTGGSYMGASMISSGFSPNITAPVGSATPGVSDSPCIRFRRF